MLKIKKKFLLIVLPIVITALSALFVWQLDNVSSKNEKIIKSCVTIQTIFGNGSGFICRIGHYYYVVTCAHVVENSPVLVIRDVENRPLKSMAVFIPNDGRDIAFIKFYKPKFKIYPLKYHKDVSSLALSQDIISYGDSLGKKIIVKGEGKLLGVGATFIEVDAPIVHGNSGGPVLLKRTNQVIAVAAGGDQPRDDEENQRTNKGTRFENDVRRYAARFDNIKPENMQKTNWGTVDEFDTKTLFKLAIDAMDAGDNDTFKNIIYYNAKLYDPPSLELWYDSTYGDFLWTILNNKEPEEDFITKNFELFKYGAEVLHVPSATLALAECYIRGRGTIADPEKGFSMIQQIAQKGNGNARFMEGMCYWLGQGTEVNHKKAFECMKKSASLNDINGLVTLGDFYLNGIGTQVDTNSAKVCFQMASDLNYVLGHYEMGICYEFGIGVPINLNEAINYYKKAADLGHSESNVKMGQFYENKKEYTKAAIYYKKAADKKFPLALYALSSFYQVGQGGFPKDKAMEIKLLKEAAEMGEPAALLQLGTYYRNGYGSLIAKDVTEAKIMFELAAEQDFSLAKYYLGQMYSNDELGYKDLNKSFNYVKEAAESGLDLAWPYLGSFYLQGFGTEKDENKAVYWIEKSANVENPLGQLLYATCYAQGLGVKQNLEQAMYWYEKAAKNDNEEAMFNLGIAYCIGLTVNVDYEKAVEWFNKAYFKGHAYSAYWLGYLYENGQGVTKDTIKAKQLFKFAKDKLQLEEEDVLKEIKNLIQRFEESRKNKERTNNQTNQK